MQCTSLDAGRSWLLNTIPPCICRLLIPPRHLTFQKTKRRFSAHASATPRNNTSSQTPAGPTFNVDQENSQVQLASRPQREGSSPPSVGRASLTANRIPKVRQQAAEGPVTPRGQVSSSLDDQRTPVPGDTAAESSASAKAPRTNYWSKLTADEKVCLKINKNVVAALNVDELLDIVELQLAQFNVVNTVTAFHRLARHCHHEPLSVKAAVRDDPRTHALCAALVGCADDWSARAVGNVAWAHAVLHHGPDNLLELVMKRVPEVEAVMQPMELTNILWACGKLGSAPPGSVERLVPILIKRVEHFDVRNITHVVWAYATLNKYDQELFETCARVVLPLLPTASPQGLANLVWSYARAEAEATQQVEHLFDEVAKQAALRWRALAAIDVANLAWAFAKVYAALDSVTTMEREGNTDLRREIRHAAMAVGPRLAFFRCISARMQELMARPSATIKGQSIAVVAWSFATVELRDEQLFNALACHARANIANLEIQALATLVWAYGQLGHFDDDLFEVLAIRSLALLPSRPRKISEDSSPSSTQPDSSQVTLLPAHPISVPGSVGAQEEGGNGTVNWEVVPHAEAPHPPLDHYSSWTPQTFSMMALAYSRNNCVQTPACRSLMTAIADEALLQVNAFDCQSLANTAWALATAGFLELPLLRELQARAAVLADGFNAVELTQLYQVDVTIRLEDPKYGSRGGVAGNAAAEDVFIALCDRGRVRSKAQRSWKLGKANTSHSGFHQDVLKTMLALGLNPVVEYTELEYSVDLALPQQHIAIEVDGPVHFSHNTFEPDGATCLKHRMLRCQGWKVVPVPFYDWDRLRESQKEEYMIRRLAAAGFKPGDEIHDPTETLPASDPLDEHRGEIFERVVRTELRSGSASHEVVGERLGRLALLRYKQGKLGKHGLLLSTANSRKRAAVGRIAKAAESKLKDIDT